MSSPASCAAAPDSLLSTPPAADAASSGASGTPALSRASCVVDVFDMHCAACAVTVEQALRDQPGVQSARVHYATQRAQISFDPAQVTLDSLLRCIERMGYSADAAGSENRAEIVRRQRHRRIWGFGLATFCAMQIMMLTLPRFLAGTDIEPELAPLLDWSALALVLPVMWWSARPFYQGAARELRLRRPGMDCAITLGTVTAFAGSVWHLLANTGALYFDSVAMFVALLLGVRWLEWEQRERNQAVIQQAAGAVSRGQALRVQEGVDGVRMVPTDVDALQPGDRVWVRTGEAIPVDGQLDSEIALCDESLLTGESVSVRRQRGENVVAGAINLGAPITVRATATAATSTEQRLLLLADNATKPETLAFADIVARYFMPALLLLAIGTFVALLPAGVATATERAIAVLIISCPCALALAAPAAHARAFSGLLARGVVLRRASALERLARSNAFLLDKTGTLSDPAVARVSELRPGYPEQRALTVIAALEQAANHPLAVALRGAHASDVVVTDADWQPGHGVAGRIAGRAYRFGRADYVGLNEECLRSDRRLWLADDEGAVCALDLSERLREDASALVKQLLASGQVELLSGDHPERAAAVARTLGLEVSEGSASPERKAARVQRLRQEGRIVVMIGDGVNDSVGFAGADVAIAVHGATDAAKASADLICESPGLLPVAEAVAYARRVVQVVRWNFGWAIAYNLLAIPFAIAGAVNPLVASVGMAGSSAIVLLNVMRLGGGREKFSDPAVAR